MEREKGITISSKITSIIHDNHLINLVDTPGHQDFGGEVERVLNLVDGVLMLVCATEGTKRQTKFVLEKSIKNHLKPLVVINKIDRESCDLEKVEESIEDLICDVATDEEYLNF